MKLTQLISNSLPKSSLYLMTFTVFTFALSCTNQQSKKAHLKIEEDSLMLAAEAFGQLHNDGLDYVLNYPDYDQTNLYQRVQLSRSFCAINNVDSTMLQFTPEDIQAFYLNYDYENPINIPQQLLNNQIIDASVKAYLDQAIQITIAESSFEQKILDLASLQQTINTDAGLNYNDKVVSLFSVTTIKSSAIYWNSNYNMLHSSLKNDCNNCIKSNKWKIAALDGIGAIFGIFTGPLAPFVSVGTAIAVSSISTCKFCSMCSGCGGADPWIPVNCNNCPSPSQYDGANCYYGRPASGTAFVMNGNYYWDDPSHQCKLNIWAGRYTQGTWDGAHCYFQIPSGYQFFMYQNGLYLKCN